MGEPSDCFAVVSVPEFTVMNFKVENRTPYEEILKSLSQIHYQKWLLNNLEY